MLRELRVIFLLDSNTTFAYQMEIGTIDNFDRTETVAPSEEISSIRGRCSDRKPSHTWCFRLRNCSISEPSPTYPHRTGALCDCFISSIGSPAILLARIRFSS